jgi:type I restriction enzyme, S subunit
MSKTLQQLAEIHYGKSPNEVLSKDGPVPVIGTGGVYGRASRALFSGPAIVVPRKGTLGHPQYLQEPFWPADTTYAVLPKQEVDARWLYYSLDLYDLSKLNEATGVPSISRDWLYRIRLGSDDYQTQQRIAEILSTVDEAIEQTEALIAKTQSIKAGLMHDLFTRGIAKDGQLRPSQEEAPQLYKQSPLGWIPKEWEVCAVESLLRNIIDYRGKTPQKTSFGIPLLTAKNVRMGFIALEPREFIAECDYDFWMTRGIPFSHDILFTTEAPLGNIAQIGIADRVAFAQRVIILQTRSEIRPLWLKHRLMASDFQLGAIKRASGTTALGIKQSEFRKILTSHPSNENEQIAIEVAVTNIAKSADSHNETAEKLTALKRALMFDLLTGRTKVTGLNKDEEPVNGNKPQASLEEG